MYPRNHGKAWLVEDSWQLAEMWVDGENWGRIGFELGRTPKSCILQMAKIRFAFLFVQGDADLIMRSVNRDVFDLETLK